MKVKLAAIQSITRFKILICDWFETTERGKHEEICISESGFDFLEYEGETEPGRLEKNPT